MTAAQRAAAQGPLAREASAHEALALAARKELELCRPSDVVIAGAIAAWDLLTECSILSDIEDPAEIDPLTSIAKRKDLIARYQAARGRKPKG